MCHRIGEYISLELFYFVHLNSSCSLIPIMKKSFWLRKHKNNKKKKRPEEFSSNSDLDLQQSAVVSEWNVMVCFRLGRRMEWFSILSNHLLKSQLPGDLHRIKWTVIVQIWSDSDLHGSLDQICSSFGWLLRFGQTFMVHWIRHVAQLAELWVWHAANCTSDSPAQQSQLSVQTLFLCFCTAPMCKHMNSNP